MAKRNDKVGIYSRTADNWYNIIVLSLIGYMTSPRLYGSLDSTMEALQKSPHASLASASQLDFSIVPNCAAWISVAIG